MPYRLESRGSGTCVMKVNGDGSKETVHCHSTRKRAMAQMRALYASEGKVGKELTSALLMHDKDIEWPEQDFQDTVKSMEEMGFIPFGPTSFAELDAEHDAQEQMVGMMMLGGDLMYLMSNIVNDPDVADKAAAMHGLVDEYVTRCGQVGQDKKEVLQNMARKMLASSDKEEDTLINKIVAVVKEKLGIVDKSRNAFMVWKDEASGQHRWLAVYSNKYRDQDFPPEILSSQAHKDFIDRVERGEEPYPELWHWHIPGSQWGKADWLCYTDEGFALASGYVLPGHEKEAEALMGMKGVRTSHGMPIASIERSADDPTVITRYSSREISDLPASAAANMLTDFNVLEVPMPIPNDKKEYLRRVGLADSAISEIEQKLGDKAKAAEVLGFENKAAVEPTVEQPEEAKETVDTSTTTEVATMTADEIAAAPIVDETDLPPTRKELAEVLAPLMESIKQLTEQATASKQAFDEFRAEREKEKAVTPPIPQQSILATMLNLSPIGKDGAAVKGNDPLTRGPKETKAPAEGRYPIPFLNRLTAPVSEEQ